MDFSYSLSCYYPDTRYPPAKLYADMLEQAQLAEELGFVAVTIPEHHFINILMNPAPLVMAVKVASVTSHIRIVTAVLVLPFLDMKRLAGEIAVTDILTDGRLQLGMGRGAFTYEFTRFGISPDESREKFDESLTVLEALLSDKEVSWNSNYYKFDPLTIMPRPLQQPHPPIWIAALAPAAIYHCARKGYNVQTTPLKGSHDLVRQQTEEFLKGAAEAGPVGRRLRLSMLRVGFVARDQADAKEKQRLAYNYYQRFTNLYETPGEVRNGAIKPIQYEQTQEQLAQNLLVDTAGKIVDKLWQYDELGIHEINLNMNIGATPVETLASMERFATKIMPHFTATPEAAISRR